MTPADLLQFAVTNARREFRPLCGLPRADAVIKLAGSMYYARALVYDLDAPHWDALDTREKHIWVARADEFLKTVQPSPVGVA